MRIHAVIIFFVSVALQIRILLIRRSYMGDVSKISTEDRASKAVREDGQVFTLYEV
jgi:hypothetical protein